MNLTPDFTVLPHWAGQIQGEGESHDGDADSIDEKSYVGADEILNLFKRIKEGP